jgi:polysaccharide export outer membrane protein
MMLPKLAAIGLFAASVGGCALPSAGPTVSQVERTADPNLDVYLVRVSPRVVSVLSRSRTEGFPQSLRLESHRPTVALRPGDSISVSIYEAGSSPLFGSGGGGSQASATSGQATPQPSSSAQATTLPAQTIEPDGQILIPFVGRVRVTGSTPTQAAEEITRRLAVQTVRPQVIVSLVGNNSNAVSVGGEVNRAGLVPLSLRGERLLDVIAQAGGPRFSAVETDVRMIRGKVAASIPLQQVLANPEDNIVVRPNDTVVLVRNPKTFVVMGAVTKVAQYPMDTERVTLAEGIARAGGTVDAYGNLAGVYLLRSEPTALVRAVMAADEGAVDASYVQTEETRHLAGPQTRMIYRVDLTQSGGYFFAQNIALRDKDIILVTNAETAQLQKAMTLFKSFSSIYFDVSRGAQFYLPTTP